MMQTGIDGGCFCGAVRIHAAQSPIHGAVDGPACGREAGASMAGWRRGIALLRAAPLLLRSSSLVERQRRRVQSAWRRVDAAGNKIDAPNCDCDAPHVLSPPHHPWASHHLVRLRTGDGVTVHAPSRAAEARA